MTRMLAGLLALGLALQAGGPAFANGRNVPAPIPVPAPVPVPEGFKYYLRGDLGWGFGGSAPDFSEIGRVYGTGGAFAINPAGSFSYGGTPFTGNSTGVDDVFNGGFGFGGYFSPHLRADITFDFRGEQGIENTSTYTYATATDTVNGTTVDTVRLRGTIGLVNAYWDLWQRGGFSPYVGAGIGFVYNDISRTYLSTEFETGGTSRQITGSSRDNHLGLAGALMAGITIASDHRFAWDLSYRALYFDGGNISTTLSSTDVSTATVGGQWEHQFRIGVRANIW